MFFFSYIGYLYLSTMLAFIFHIFPTGGSVEGKVPEKGLYRAFFGFVYLFFRDLYSFTCLSYFMIAFH